MALAYAVVLVSTELYDHDRYNTVGRAQAAADKQFEKLAQERMKTLVTRNPEPRVMTVPELRNAFPDPDFNLVGLMGLYFTADIA